MLAAAAVQEHIGNKQLAIDLRHENEFAGQIKEGQLASETSHWECMGCGFDVYDDQPPEKCPKCSWGSFEVIKIKHRMVI